MIELAQLEDMFAGIASGPKWDMSKPMLWGYFFTDESVEKLESIVPDLERHGCRFVDIFTPELEAGEPPYFFLHVECEEVHTPATLFQRNQAFYALAEQHGLLGYDGMDVSPLNDQRQDGQSKRS